ncbi:MAG: type II CAAX endopeptidase family protein [Terracidiphilus sp.]|jgi:membrane protease YdiL (CAAX protease family)
MRDDEMVAAESAGMPKPLEPIASMRHFIGLLLIGAGVVAAGFYAQHAGSGAAPSGQLAGHGVAIQIYLFAISLDWALFYYCWAGVHHRGGSLWSLAGGRWNSWRSVAVDLAIALPFWLIWEGAAYGVHLLLGASSAKSVDSLLPHSFLEVLVWIATCATAGICEEMVFRGYLQRQLHAFTGNLVTAVVAQGAIFGAFHAYQGWKNVAVICVLGVLYGMLAAWRRNLRVNIISHAWSDIWEGWLKFLVWH